MKIFASALIALCALIPPHVYAAITPEDLKAAQATVQEFQKLPTAVMFCDSGEKYGARGEKFFADPNSRASMYLKPIYTRFFSQEFYRLFMWVQCRAPKAPPPIKNGIHVEFGPLNYNYNRDFRFGTELEIDVEEWHNIQTQRARVLSKDTIGVKVVYDDSPWKLSTNYILVKEDGLWRIDDMAPKEVATEMEIVHWGSKSLKTELQILYRHSEERYRREQAQSKSKSGSVTRQ